jgi:hypothetical protein
MAPTKVNPFKPSDQVRIKDNRKTGGVVKYVACFAATTVGGKMCDKKTCVHKIRDYVWVRWGDNSVYSYDHNELGFEHPVVGAPIVAANPEGAIDNEALALIEKQIARQENKLDYSLYNGLTQIRHGRDGTKYLVDMTGSSFAEAPEIKENELDYDVYNGKTPGNVRKSNG